MNDINRLIQLSEVEVAGKAVLVRGDFDVDDGDNPRANSIREVTRELVRRGAGKVRVIGHCETGYDLAGELAREFPGVEFDAKLRADPGEKANETEYARRLAAGWEVYVNESFAVSHRKHASIVALPKVMASEGKAVCVGPRFEKEIEMLSEVWGKTGRRVLVIGGVKVEDKSKFAVEMANRFEWVLTGGKIPEYFKNQIANLNIQINSNIQIPKLRPDGLDLAAEAIAQYVKLIGGAEVILAAGVMGKYEDPGAAAGTRAVLEAIAANEQAYKVAGGGDIEMAISSYGLAEKFDWISVGGGAMLVYLGTGTLPGIEAMKSV